MVAYGARVLTAVFLPLALYGCERSAGDDNGATSPDNPAFQIPSDGKLTEKQVTDYVVIRQKIIRDFNRQELAKQNYLAEHKEDPAAGADFRYFDQIEKSAAHSFGMSYEEFLWIKDTVISTQTTILVQRYYDLNNKIMMLLDKTLNRYEDINAGNPDGREQRKMEGYIDEMKREISDLREKIPDRKQRPDALAHNIAIVSMFQNELEALNQQVTQQFFIKGNTP